MDKYYTEIDPAEVTPNHTELILTGITWRGEFNFYILPRNALYIDFCAYLKERYPMYNPEDLVVEELEERFNIYTIDEEHEEYFMHCIQPYKREGTRLREEMQMCISCYEVYEYYPCVLINFDRKTYLCHNWEPYFWEKYVPEGWVSEFRTITDEDFPEDKRYWLEEDGSDLFKKLYEELEKKGD